MTRLRRSALLTLTVALLTLAPAAAVYATDCANDRSDQATNRVTDRTRTTAQDPAADRGTDVATDRPTDAVTDRARDTATDRTKDRAVDSLRPWFKRCVHYVQSDTDHELRRNLRWWWHVCHRVRWNLAHPE